MNEKKLQKGCVLILAIYLILAAAFYWISGDQLHYRDEETDMLAPAAVAGEITAGDVFSQKIEIDGDCLLSLTLLPATYGRQNTGILHLEIYDEGILAASQDVDISTLEDNSQFAVPFGVEPAISGPVELRITAPESMPENAVTLYIGHTRAIARGQIEVELGEADRLYRNGEALDGALCVQVRSREYLTFGTYYWYFAGGLFVLLAVCCLDLDRKYRAGKHSIILSMIDGISRYRYLIKQLVARDFKTKYKRSVLGILWSFLNPLLTMLVQYVVFSTLFRSDVPNFAVYLLTGIVCFSFFNEATTMALSSIVGNASLITKVYVPKYIYPLTRVMSSTINFLLALIPLFAVALLTGLPLRPSVLLLPCGIICLFALCLGVGLFLAAAMVFFRDTQFLWGVLSMLWMYATPIFYPESIIPAKIMPLYKCNPLYHIIRFFRIVLIDGVSPEPKAYGLMILASVLPLLLGLLVFKKTQDRFVLNI